MQEVAGQGINWPMTPPIRPVTSEAHVPITMIIGGTSPSTTETAIANSEPTAPLTAPPISESRQSPRATS